MKQDERQKAGTIIAAGGSSQRMGSIDKLFAPLGGKPMLIRVIDAFQRCDSIDQIVVVLSEPNLERGQQLVAEPLRLGGNP
ncbi:MAG: ispD [Dehalococcoidales bacterium]|nr:ispD [Dehalococcoidales bacterium]